MTATRYLTFVLISALLWLMGGCGQQGDGALQRIRETGTLVVLTRNAPTTYYVGREGPTGFEHDLVTAFAASLGVTVTFDIRETIADILQGIAKGEGDIAAAGLTRTTKRETAFLFGPDYYQVQQQVICHRDGKRPADVHALPQVSLLIIADSSYEERLEELREQITGLQWQTTDTLSTEEILAQVWHRKVDCTVADSNIVAINRRYYPELVVAFPLTEEQSLAWVLRPGGTDIRKTLEAWFDAEPQDDLLKTLQNRYYSHVDIFDYVDLKTFQQHVRQRLGRFRRMFEQAAQAHGFPWTLLAAQGYQESHWDPKAKSPTGVRGLMMLTQQTAQSVGVRNRLDAAQSIRGGAGYMAHLYRRIPTTVQGRNRLWYTLAAYNVGLGHILDAMALSRRLGKTPSSWNDLKQVLPLLSQRKYFKTLKYGYARGTEPIRYVRRIRNYRDMLEAHTGKSRPKRSSQD